MTPYQIEESKNFHESGHCVFSALVGVPFEYASAFSATTRDAQIAFDKELIESRLDRVEDDHDGASMLIVKFAMANLAGPVCEAIFAGSDDWRPYASATDMKNVATMLRMLSEIHGEPYDSEDPDPVDELAECVHATLTAPLTLASIRRVAGELRQRRQLRQREVRRIVAAAHGRVWHRVAGHVARESQYAY